MKILTLLLGVALSGAAVSPALAAATAALPKASAAATSTVADNAQTGSAAQPRLICRRQGVTGTRLGGERICLTKKDWRIVDNGGSVTSYRNKAAASR